MSKKFYVELIIVAIVILSVIAYITIKSCDNYEQNKIEKSIISDIGKTEELPSFFLVSENSIDDEYRIFVNPFKKYFILNGEMIYFRDCIVHSDSEFNYIEPELDESGNYVKVTVIYIGNGNFKKIVERISHKP